MNDYQSYIPVIAGELSLQNRQVAATISLLEEGATVPFITRYRKEATGSLDETAVTAVRDRLQQLRELDKRRESILASLEERELLTDELRDSILAAETLTALEDIYLPYRPKRRTRAAVAREKGLEPLAAILFEQGDIDPEQEAEAYIDPEKGVETVEDALSGARDIIAEQVNEDRRARERLRELFVEQGMFRSQVVTGKEEHASKYRDYFDWEESISTAPSHRILAMRRGEQEGMLSLRIVVPEEPADAILEELFIKGGNAASQQVRLAVHDAYKRLLAPSLETEMRMETKQHADEKAIRVFAENVRELLLAAPLGKKNILSVDPGFRTGCKICCLDSQGKLLTHDTIFPHQSEHKAEEAGKLIAHLCETYEIEIIAVGNGTAGRETEEFLRGLTYKKPVSIIMVNESGASIYSTSEAAREEFPDLDATVRGTVSIGRRLMDPLAELVKIDPKSIGVGQYQHDVDQSHLREKLDDVVISCVNNVGVEVNTASRQLLTYVSGLGPSLAKKIVEYRDEKGPFTSRKELKKVPRLGDKAFEQAAGFLRIRDGNHPLDASAVHPESYHVVDKMAANLGCSARDLILKSDLRKRIHIQDYVNGQIGLPTLQDIMDELEKPGRDPRDSFEIFSFSEQVKAIEDLETGMKVPGIVTNVTAFGAFVDIGVHQDGLVHISQLADKYVKDPSDIVKVHQKVMVTVLDVDIPRNRISLSMKSNAGKSNA